MARWKIKQDAFNALLPSSAFQKIIAIKVWLFIQLHGRTWGNTGDIGINFHPDICWIEVSVVEDIITKFDMKWFNNIKEDDWI